MKDGIYFVKFASDRDYGAGIVTIKNGIVNGGDHGFIYKGHVEGDKVNLVAKQHDSAVPSVFGNISEFDLNLVSIQTSDGYQLKGTTKLAPGSQINISAKFIGELLT
ncbi:GrlR family regulatory protein [Acinetobacter baumannii]|uniref:GrlR family regulatory protein n=1 Tax=Acinetobacter baumannii TaxID=470 RepID=UPI0004F7A9D6|nr:GrlR family regulatory protein [Acinetobacter baumannii]AIL75969.1 negative regulator GrlR [Acinetobacter baumannii]MBJ9482421.1 negative regulator GrlR [Acinetobacter baumannii]MBJ9909733.1 negative regulator GrlR [Acinetobacter baumannii]MBJ9944220.1 negative regulator GrlR [Acinetobacter baumannii]MCZ2995825.1 negative regulator GrlR [Acinetobacter baumannii]